MFLRETWDKSCNERDTINFRWRLNNRGNARISDPAELAAATRSRALCHANRRNTGKKKKEEEEKKEIKAIRKTEEERSVRRRGKRKRVKSFKCMQGDEETDRQTLVLHSALLRNYRRLYKHFSFRQIDTFSFKDKTGFRLWCKQIFTFRIQETYKENIRKILFSSWSCYNDNKLVIFSVFRLPMIL